MAQKREKTIIELWDQRRRKLKRGRRREAGLERKQRRAKDALKSMGQELERQRELEIERK